MLEIGLVVLEKDFYKIHQCIFVIWLLIPLGKERGPSFEET